MKKLFLIFGCLIFVSTACRKTEDEKITNQIIGNWNMKDWCSNDSSFCIPEEYYFGENGKGVGYYSDTFDWKIDSGYLLLSYMGYIHKRRF